VETSSAPKRIRIGDILVAQQIISQQQLETALAEQKKTGYKLGRQLVALGFVEENTLLSFLSKQLNYPYIDLVHYRFERETVQKLPETVARRYRVIVLKEDHDGILLGMSDPTDIFGLDDIKKILQKPIKPAVVRESDLLDILDCLQPRQ
jgi:MSHA biogenesis protein MshE